MILYYCCKYLVIVLHKFEKKARIIYEYAGMVEWQTRWTQNPLWATMCGFKSHFRHQLKNIGFRLCFLNFIFVSLSGAWTGGYRQLRIYNMGVSCRQTVDTYCLPHRRDSERSVTEQVPLSAPIKKHRFPPMFFKFYIRKFKWGLNGWVSATENL